MSVGRICNREVDTARPVESVYVIAERMHQRAVGSLVVVNDASEPIGIVTDRDLVARVLAKRSARSNEGLATVMTAGRTNFGRESDSVGTGPNAKRNFRRLPVVDPDHKLVGLVELGGATS